MKTNKTSILLLIIMSLGLVSCVSKKKFKNSETRIQSLRNDSTRFQNELKKLSQNLANTEQQSSANSADLNSKLDEKNSLLNETSESLRKKGEMLEERERKVKELQAKIDAQNAMVANLKSKIQKALVNFSDNQLTVTTKDGKVYVSLSENLLFKSGSAVVEAGGKVAISKVAEVLNNNTDINILIEGHTDSVPFNSSTKDNWSLSVDRATSIVRILTKEYLVSPKKVTAAGRSEYFPIASNATPEGRAKNRRTEIILSPNLEELFDIMK